MRFKAGDEIAVFSENGELCVGATKWDGVLGAVALTIWGDDTTTEDVDGLLDGETFTLRVWDSLTNTEYAASVVFISGEAVYQKDGWYIVGGGYWLYLPLVTSHAPN